VGDTPPMCFLFSYFSPTFYYFLSFDLHPFTCIREGREGKEESLAERREHNDKLAWWLLVDEWTYKAFVRLTKKLC
jgi:hypothetical protein